MNTGVKGFTSHSVHYWHRIAGRLIVPGDDFYLSSMSNVRKVHNQWTKELKDIIRGASGGFLFGAPLLYTMEVWWIGTYVSMARVFIAIVVTFAIVFLLNRTAGFRETSTMQPVEAIMDTVEALAIGMICAGVILWLLQVI